MTVDYRSLAAIKRENAADRDAEARREARIRRHRKRAAIARLVFGHRGRRLNAGRGERP